MADGITEKLTRAQEHVITLDDATSAFFNKKPYVLTGKHNQDGTEYIVKIRFTEPIPERISVLIGDVLYQLRSSLDHIAWQMAEAGTGGTNVTEFPIFNDRAKFFAVDESGEPSPGSGLIKIAGIANPDARAFITAVQPFSRPKGRSSSWPLWVLQVFNLHDKHRFLLASSRTNKGSWNLPFKDVDTPFQIVFPPGIKTDGAVVARYLLSVPYADVDMHVTPALAICLRDVKNVTTGSTRKRAVDLLDEMVQLVGWIIFQCRGWA